MNVLLNDAILRDEARRMAAALSRALPAEVEEPSGAFAERAVVLLRRMRHRRTCRTLGRRVAAAVVTAALALGMVLAVSPVARAAVSRWFLRVTTAATVYRITPSEDGGGQGDYVPTAPAGYAPAGDLTGREEGIRVVRWTSRWGDLLFESVPLTGGTRISVELRDGATGGLHNTATGLRPMGEEGAPEGYTRTEVTVHGVAAQLYRFAAGTDGNCRPYGLWFYRGDEMEHFHYVEVPAGAAALVWVDEHANRLFLLTGGLTEKEFLSVAESVYGNERSGTV